MKDLFDVDYREKIRRQVRKQLKEQYGIKVPKDKTTKQQPQEENQENGVVFGVSLDAVPSINVGEENFCPVPRFLVDTVLHLKDHLQTEGLFRKSGSLGRQKQLRKQIECGLKCNYSSVQPHDVASLMKQFFREMPDPLLTTGLYSGFLKALTLMSENEKTSAMLLLCLLLPDENLRVFRYVTDFVNLVAKHSDETKMSLSNLAIVLSPNIMFSTKDRNSDKCLKEQTQVVDTLFHNGHVLGLVPDDVMERVNSSDTDGGACPSSGDEVENAERIGRTRHRLRQHRRRSKSISGFVMGLGKKIRQTNSRSSQDDGVMLRHQRSKSEKSISTMRSDCSLYSSTPVAPARESRCMSTDELDGLHLFSDQVYSKSTRSKSLKRKQSDNSSIASAGARSPKIATRQPKCHTITSPKLVTMSTQFMMTPRRHLHAVKSVDAADASPLARLPPLDVRKLNSLHGHKPKDDCLRRYARTRASSIPPSSPSTTRH